MYITYQFILFDILLIQVKYKKLTSLYALLLFHIYNIIFLNISSVYIDNHIQWCYNFCFNLRQNLKNSREGKFIVFTYMFSLFTFFLPFLRSKSPSFIIYFLCSKLLLATLLWQDYLWQVFLIFFHLRITQFFLHFWKIFLLNIKF